MPAGAHAVSPVDPFDLPDWLGEGEVCWRATSGLRGHLVRGVLTGDGQVEECDLLACDLAHPLPVLEEKWRGAAHQAWAFGESLLLRYDGRLAVVVPGTEVTLDLVLAAVRRVAKAVGARPSDYAVLLRL